MLLLLSFVFFVLCVCFDFVRENKICTCIHTERRRDGGWKGGREGKRESRKKKRKEKNMKLHG